LDQGLDSMGFSGDSSIYAVTHGDDHQPKRPPSPLHAGTREGLALGTTRDELFALGMPEPVVPATGAVRLPCVWVGSAVLNTHPTLPLASAAFAVVNTGRVTLPEVDTVRFRGWEAVVLYGADSLVLQPSASETMDPLQARARRLSLPYAAIRFWCRLLGNKKLVALAARGQDGRYLQVYLRFAKKAWRFVAHVHHQWRRALASRVSVPSGPRRCPCPTTSSSAFGRSRSASGRGASPDRPADSKRSLINAF
jgi:hypothetical protein